MTKSCFVHYETPVLIIKDTSLLGQGFWFELDSQVRTGVVSIMLACPMLKKIFIVIELVCESQKWENKTMMPEQLTMMFVCILNSHNEALSPNGIQHRPTGSPMPKGLFNCDFSRGSLIQLEQCVVT